MDKPTLPPPPPPKDPLLPPPKGPLPPLLKGLKPRPSPIAHSLKLLQSPNPNQRFHAAWSLSATQHPKAVNALLAALLREEVPHVLQKITDSLISLHPQRIVPRLLAQLNAPQDPKHTHIVRLLAALAKNQHEKSQKEKVGAVFAALLSKELSSSLHIATLRGLATLQSTAHLELLLRSLEHTNSHIRSAAISAISAVGIEGQSETFLHALQALPRKPPLAFHSHSTPTRQDTQQAAPSLSDLFQQETAQWKHTTQHAIRLRAGDLPALQTIAHDPTHPLRPCAIWTLGQLKDHTFLPHADALFQDDNNPEDLRAAALGAYIQLQHDTQVIHSLLADLMQPHTNLPESFRRICISALFELDAETAFALLSNLYQPDSDTQPLPLLADHPWSALFQEGITSSQERTRMQALSLLQILPLLQETRLRALVACTQDPSAPIRTQARALLQIEIGQIDSTALIALFQNPTTNTQTRCFIVLELLRRKSFSICTEPRFLRFLREEEVDLRAISQGLAEALETQPPYSTTVTLIELLETFGTPNAIYALNPLTKGFFRESRIKSAAQYAIDAIQDRHPHAELGGLSLADEYAESGALSLSSQTSSGALSLKDKHDN